MALCSKCGNNASSVETLQLCNACAVGYEAPLGLISRAEVVKWLREASTQYGGANRLPRNETTRHALLGAADAIEKGEAP